MKVFVNLEQALSEIQRDIKKAPLMDVTRVQQRTGEELKAHEIIGYSYSILPGGIPTDTYEVVMTAIEQGLEFYSTNRITIQDWLNDEKFIRVDGMPILHNDLPNELAHPALRSTIEGSWPAYTYQERLDGAMDSMVATLQGSKDSRRAFWSLWRTEDSLRAKHPTRVPCSISYQAMIREVNGEDQLEFIYTMRSSDFDTFFVSDVWLANQFQIELATRLNINPGNFIHMISSLHSFKVAEQEIY